ncbi:MULTISPECIES: scytonemin biosynthesis sensor histidine kinase [Cyanophyceae]|uniref:scytonemin biosynthesis sensor histidine kinase n=1 Tax=Cyanophyceae TaxID=3028117 RepID=UPI00232E0553|nr:MULTISPECIES: scytonemin biosynthesis sensor histidine kinase [Cyanophyceae]MDB9355992.1 PAS domain S-box protein [Nodularia spumigena CS-587/03]MDB9340052.1 PAS domain S-box protein [Nodularia spumigena CS-589/07]MDB9399122.1 PAS domain S-box protein [Microcystis aeruginosa CS-567/02-A1]MDB9500250.1 PAS domain S-box protein [Nodularia spumigena CS-336/02]MDB9534120.1 PAS domain S-box protein [Nodularia spumigena CS-1038]
MNSSEHRLVLSNSQSQLQPEIDLKIAHFLINQSVDPAFCLGENQQFIYVNDATCKMTEYSREELLSLRLHDIDIDWSLHNWSDIKSQDDSTFKSRYRAKGGRIFLVEIAIIYVENQGQKFGCAVVRDKSDAIIELSVQTWMDELRNAKNYFQQEVSQLTTKEVELGISLSIFNSTLESTAVGIVAVNFQGDILSLNQKFIDMWQIPQSLILSHKCPHFKAFFENKLKDPEAFSRLICEISSQCDSESYYILELKDGRTFAHQSKPHYLGDKIVGRVWSIWDITQTQETEATLRLNEARFRTLAETTEANIFLLQNTRLCYINPAVERLTGYKKEELLNDFDLRRLIKSREHRQVRHQNAAANFEYQEMNLLKKDGTERWLACAVAKLDGMLDFGGKPVELITGIDITDYKNVESELNQALEQAKQLSELRARFLAMVCHQFRTPLNIVSFSNSLLKQQVDKHTEQKIQPLLDHIEKAIEQISQMLDDTLFFAKAETAKINFEPQPLDLVNLCDILVAQMHMSMSQKPINFVSQFYCLMACVDPKLLEPILKNLLENAIKYSPSNMRVDFMLACENGQVIFQVKDKGIGIPYKDQQRLFEPFYRGSNVDNIPGTGLGLSIIKTLVDLHGGQVSVESEVAVGTTFTVMLPLIKAESVFSQ